MSEAFRSFTKIEADSTVEISELKVYGCDLQSREQDPTPILLDQWISVRWINCPFRFLQPGKIYKAKVSQENI